MKQWSKDILPRTGRIRFEELLNHLLTDTSLATETIRDLGSTNRAWGAHSVNLAATYHLPQPPSCHVALRHWGPTCSGRTNPLPADRAFLQACVTCCGQLRLSFIPRAQSSAQRAVAALWDGKVIYVTHGVVRIETCLEMRHRALHNVLVHAG